MAPESGSITTGDEIRSTLAEEQSTEYSDVKVPPSPMCNEGFSREKNYWFGKKYFECVLAQYILKSSHTYQSSTDIDVSIRPGDNNAMDLMKLRADKCRGFWMPNCVIIPSKKTSSYYKIKSAHLPTQKCYANSPTIAMLFWPWLEVSLSEGLEGTDLCCMRASGDLEGRQI